MEKHGRLNMPWMDAGNRMIWQVLKLYLPAGTRLTSVHRSPYQQLAFIIRTARQKGYTVAQNPILGDRSTWAGALDYIRARGYKVAEPGRSVYELGLAYDLSGPSLNEIEKAVRKAVTEGRIRLVRPDGIIVEHHNGCVHVEIDGGLLDFEAFELA